MSWPLALALALVGAASTVAQSLDGFRTDTSKKSIRLEELQKGGPPKDGIPAISDPKFVGVEEASRWLHPHEPVQVVRHAGEVRVYPLQILIWHELVNDRIADLPLLASFCPLCNAAVVFDRRVEGEELEFGVSGLLRHSDMIMFDRRTESLWQQLTGEAIVGEMTGRRLEVVSSQVVPFAEASSSFPGAKVLSRDTGHRRDYGRNPYELYESRGRLFFPVSYKKSGSIKPLRRLLTFRSGNRTKAYLIRELRNAPLQAGGRKGGEYVVFYQPEMLTPLGARRIAEAEAVGTVGVFSPFVKGELLEFEIADGSIRDRGTGSTWNLFGQATDGPLSGEQLDPVEHGVYYAFAWLAFEPRTDVIRLK